DFLRCMFPGRYASCPAQIHPEDRLSHPSSGRQQSDSWCHRKFGHAVGNSCFVANWRTKRPGTRTYWANPGHTLSVRKKVCAKPRRSPGRKVSTNPRVATMLDGGSLVGPDCEFLCRQVPHAKSRTP